MQEILHERLLNGNKKLILTSISIIMLGSSPIGFILTMKTKFLIVGYIPIFILILLWNYYYIEIHRDEIKKGKNIEKEKGKLILELKFRTFDNKIFMIIYSLFILSIIVFVCYVILFQKQGFLLSLSFAFIGFIGIMITLIWDESWKYLWIYENGIGYDYSTYEKFTNFKEIEEIELKKLYFNLKLHNNAHRIFYINESNKEQVLSTLKNLLGTKWNKMYTEKN